KNFAARATVLSSRTESTAQLWWNSRTQRSALPCQDLFEPTAHALTCRFEREQFLNFRLDASGACARLFGMLVNLTHQSCGMRDRRLCPKIAARVDRPVLPNLGHFVIK